ncbi:MAG: FAD:protein FMN transferase [Flavobacteriaceae bacterium]|nr:FAD:protein FMN transferase [Flavobacteriaceae bacterium]
MKKIYVFFFLIVVFGCADQTGSNYSKLKGIALGTSFHITYKNANVVISEKQIDSLIYLINKSMSTYLPTSDISKINKGDTSIIVDKMFQEVFIKSEKKFKETGGAFDPTIGILVNAWGFGPDNVVENLDSSHVNSMLEFVGFQKVKLKNNKIVKEYRNTYIDFNAIAKGFAVDVIGRFLELKKIDNYLIEIGGEIRARGSNPDGKIWRIAIEKPNFDGTRSFQTVIELDNESIATSGNYRKFKIDAFTGKKFAHTIDTETGFPSQSNLLSASVIAKLDCADVDAYATAFMAMGFKKSKLFLQKHPNLKCFFIYSNDDGDIKTFTSDNLNTSD